MLAGAGGGVAVFAAELVEPAAVFTPDRPAVLSGPPVVGEVPVDPDVPPTVPEAAGAAVGAGVTTMVDPPGGTAGAATVPPAAALLLAAGGTGVDEPAADGAIALLRTGVSPVVTPPAPPAPALWCDWLIELPFALVSTPDPRVLRFRSYSVPDKIPPGASLSGTE